MAAEQEPPKWMQKRAAQTQGANADSSPSCGCRNKMCIPAAAQNKTWLGRGRGATRHAGKQGKPLQVERSWKSSSRRDPLSLFSPFLSWWKKTSPPNPAHAARASHSHQKPLCGLYYEPCRTWEVLSFPCHWLSLLKIVFFSPFPFPVFCLHFLWQVNEVSETKFDIRYQANPSIGMTNLICICPHIQASRFIAV